jgi:predicted methyltransferase
LTEIPNFGWDKAQSQKEKEAAFVAMLKMLKPGNTYLFVEHPANKTEEMKAVGNKTMKTVARDRHWVTEVFTSQLVMKTIKDKGIELINYTKVGTPGK